MGTNKQLNWTELESWSLSEESPRTVVLSYLILELQKFKLKETWVRTWKRLKCVSEVQRKTGSFSEDLDVKLINTDCLQLHLAINHESYKNIFLVTKLANSLEEISMLDRHCEDKTKIWCLSKLDEPAILNRTFFCTETCVFYVCVLGYSVMSDSLQHYGL